MKRRAIVEGETKRCRGLLTSTGWRWNPFGFWWKDGEWENEQQVIDTIRALHPMCERIKLEVSFHTQE